MIYQQRYGVTLMKCPNLPLIKEIENWVGENIEGDWGKTLSLCYWFELKSDAAKFIMFWHDYI